MGSINLNARYDLTPDDEHFHSLAQELEARIHFPSISGVLPARGHLDTARDFD